LNETKKNLWDIYGPIEVNLLSYAESKKSVSFTALKSLGIGQTSGMWWVGEKIAGRRWLCYCSAGAAAKKSNNKTMAACSSSRLNFLKLEFL
jgi:hypothetical protein